ncbi:MAG TPA: phospholipase D family protein [Clostridia bacterium]|nr:phospholipase D family protein [Clostridia bacterium]
MEVANKISVDPIAKEIKVSKIMRNIIIVYLLYALMVGGIVFAFHSGSDSGYFNDNTVERFWSDEVGQDRVVLIEGRAYSGDARINLIENAKETLDIAYFTIDEGVSSDIFWGKILESANRGVKIRVLVDGFFHNFKGASKDIRYTLINHPNIQLKLYEPFCLIKPWTWNNRLHDKYIIVDRELAMIGGRNIGDRYFIQDNANGDIVHDRDVLIINRDLEGYENSVVYEMKDYFDMVWNHEYTKGYSEKLKEDQIKKGKLKGKYLIQFIADIEKSNPEVFNKSIDWHSKSMPTNKITLIHNPMGRLNKEPWVWGEIVRLMERAESSIFIQSPYVVPTKKMLNYISTDDISSKETTILTNSRETSPNYPGIAGYMKYRRNIVDSADYVYEYQGIGSIHAKSYIIDDRISLVGSFNLDSRSAFLNTETMVVIDSKEFSQELMGEIDQLTGQSLLVGKDYSYKDNPLVEEVKPHIIKGLIIKVLSLVTYFFDYLI